MIFLATETNSWGHQPIKSSSYDWCFYSTTVVNNSNKKKNPRDRLSLAVHMIKVYEAGILNFIQVLPK